MKKLAKELLGVLACTTLVLGVTACDIGESGNSENVSSSENYTSSQENNSSSEEHVHVWDEGVIQPTASLPSAPPLSKGGKKLHLIHRKRSPFSHRRRQEGDKTT